MNNINKNPDLDVLAPFSLQELFCKTLKHLTNQEYIG